MKTKWIHFVLFVGVCLFSVDFCRADPDPTPNCTKPLSKLAVWKGYFNQARHLPETLRRIKTLVNRDVTPEFLDENLHAYWGFHQIIQDRHYRQKTWRKAPTEKAQVEDIINMSLWEFVGVMRYAMEVEDPILGYSFASGQGFRFLLPTMGRFMGKNAEQAEFVKTFTKGDKWCESAWCEEERRHGNTLGKLIAQITKVKPNRDNPVTPFQATADEAGAQFHHYSRQSTEWSASSSYYYLAAHTKPGALREGILNMARDEIKHLTILTSVQVYIFGKNPWTRFKEMVKKSYAEFKDHKKEGSGRSTGSEISSNPVAMIEILYAHYRIEKKFREYMKTLPVGFLREILETPTKVEDIQAVAVSEDIQAENNRLVDAGAFVRRSFVRWPDAEAREELRQITFEEINIYTLDKIIAEKLGGFKGAETFGSDESKAVLAKVAELQMKDFPLVGWLPNAPTEENFQKALSNRLRQYQIQKNFYIRTGDPKPALPEVP